MREISTHESTFIHAHTYTDELPFVVLPGSEYLFPLPFWMVSVIVPECVQAMNAPRRAASASMQRSACM